MNRSLLVHIVVVTALIGAAGLAGCDEAASPDEPSPAAMAAQPTEAVFAEWSQDGDRGLDRGEFEAGFVRYELFERWDADRSGALDAEEFYTTLFVVFDTNDNGYLSQLEWARSLERWLPERADDLADFGTADTSDDVRISPREFVDVLPQSELFERWDDDADQRLSRDEFIGRLFVTWDLDGDRRLSAGEFGF